MTKKGYRVPRAVVERRRASLLKKYADPEYRERHRQIHFGRVVTAMTREKLRTRALEWFDDAERRSIHLKRTRATNMGRMQAPERKQRPTGLDIAWAAGIWEGEGSVTGCKAKNFAQIYVYQKDPHILERLKDLFGGRVYLRSQPGRSDGYIWRIHGTRARGFVLTIWRFLSPRRKAQILRRWTAHPKHEGY